MKRSLLTFFLIPSTLINHASTGNTNELEPKIEIAINQKLGTEQLREQYAAYRLYKQQYSKPDADANLEYRRFTTYLENVEKIYQHNERYKRGEETYEMGINRFTDMLPEELNILSGDRNIMKDLSNARDVFNITIHKNLPEQFDWRPLGAVTPVKDQGTRCNSSWAFSATGALEGQHYMKTGKLISLSEQNLMDCSDRSYGNYGCRGGKAIYAYDYVINNDGINTEESYSYEEQQGSCRYKIETRGTTAFKRVILAVGDEIQLQAAVAEYGPISVSIDAKDLGLYKKGIYSPRQCSQWTNHDVLVVGYGSEEKVFANGTKMQIDYWIMKNSWDQDWGEDGYFRLIRNRNMCGVATLPSLPFVPEAGNL